MVGVINAKCPLQSECDRKRCEYQHHERDCKYYQSNARPGVEIDDQEAARDADWEAHALAELDAHEIESTPASDVPGKVAQLMTQLSVDKLFPHPDNPRKDLGDLTELADSIKSNGIFQNLTVVPDNKGYTVIIGHRRLAAAKLAGLTEVPCVITEMDQKEQVQTMLLENMQRSDLTVYEQAKGFQLMLDLGSTVEEIAEKSGFSKTTVRRRVKLLELDADKFKKSESRGATLQDYLELEKIEDPELKNKALDTIGTANFRDTVKKAIDEEKLKKRLAQWEKDLEAFALKIEKRDYVGETSVPMDYVMNYGRWSPKDKMVEKPEDVNEVKYYYRVSADQIDLYKDHQEYAETEEDRQRKEKQRIANQIKAELKEATERHFSLRSEFISEFSASKKYLAEICKYAAGVIVGDGGWGRDWINTELAGKLLDLDIDDNTDYPTFAVMVEQHISEAPEYALLACAYTSVDQDTQSYWAESWNTEKREYEIVHKPNDNLDHLYDFLVSIGYEMSDEEKALRNGTHELFHREETEEKAPAKAEAGQEEE